MMMKLKYVLLLLPTHFCCFDNSRRAQRAFRRREQMTFRCTMQTDERVNALQFIGALHGQICNPTLRKNPSLCQHVCYRTMIND